MKKLLFVCLLFAFTNAFSQDTIYVKKVKVVNLVINRKTGHAMRKWVRHPKVPLGYIIKRNDGLYVVNGKVMVPDNYNPDSFIVKK